MPTRGLSYLIIIIFCLTTACVVLAIPPAYAQQSNYVQRSDDELVILEVYVGRASLADTIIGYSTKSGLLLPLQQIAEALEIKMQANQQEGIAEGWFMEPDNRLNINIGNREVIIRGSRKPLIEGQAEAHADDIYVDSELLTEWLQIDFDFSFNTQSIELQPREGIKLPIQLQAEREQARERIARGEVRGLEGPFVKYTPPYQLYTIPTTDVTYFGGYDKRAYNGQHNGLSALADGDLLYMHSSIYASFEDSRKFREIRWTLSRRDPDGKLLLPDDKLHDTALGRTLHDYEIREVSFGDLSTPQLPLTAFNQQGRGVMISNIPYDRATNYDRTTIQGDLQEGWDVELYRNDQLLSFQRASGNGRYEFIDVPLVSGVNLIRLVFYGPFGQTREELQRFLVSDELTRQGKSYFRTSLSQQNTNSFDVINQNQITNLTAITPQQSAAIKGKTRALFEYEYGLLNNLSFFASTAHLTTPDNEARTYLSSGLATTIAGAYGRVDVARDISDGGNAIKLQLQDNIAGFSVSAEHQQYFDFVSEFTESASDSITRRSTIRMDRPLTIPYLPRMNHGVSATQLAYESDRQIDELTYRLSTSINRLALSNNLSYRTDSIPSTFNVVGIGGGIQTVTTKSEQTIGNFLMSYPYQQWVFRGSTGYELSPEKEIQTLLTSAEYIINPDTNAIFQVDHQFISERLTNYTFGLNRRFKHFRLGGTVSRNSEGENTVGINISTSIGENPRTGDIEFYPDYSANYGMISARAYHDINGNNQFDAEDKPLENARFLVNRGGNQDRTDENGNIILRNLPADVRNSLTMDQRSLENPFLMSQNIGADVVTRPGVPAVVDFPVTGSGDVEGTISMLSIQEEAPDANEEEAASVILQLFDANGKLVRETESSYDGYYLFNGVPAGTYTLRVSAAQGARVGFITPPDREVIIRNDETDSHIIDMEVIREPEPQELDGLTEN